MTTQDHLAHIFKPDEDYALCGRGFTACGDIIEIADYETDTAGGMCAECESAHSALAEGPDTTASAAACCNCFICYTSDDCPCRYCDTGGCECGACKGFDCPKTCAGCYAEYACALCGTRIMKSDDPHSPVVFIYTSPPPAEFVFCTAAHAKRFEDDEFTEDIAPYGTQALALWNARGFANAPDNSEGFEPMGWRHSQRRTP